MYMSSHSFPFILEESFPQTSLEPRVWFDPGMCYRCRLSQERKLAAVRSAEVSCRPVSARCIIYHACDNRVS